MARKCLLILLDGLGDRSHPELDHQTPLQAAYTPNLDRLAALGANGLYHAATPGLALPSENAHFAMFGYPARDFPGRGALEALGADIPLDPTEVAFLAHLVELQTADDCLILAKDHPQASPEEAQNLAEDIAFYRQEESSVQFLPTHGLFGIVRLRGRVAPFVTDTNTMNEGRPLPEPLPWQEYADDPAAGNSAELLKNYLLWGYRRLNEHPVNLRRRQEGRGVINGLVTQRGGQLKKVADFRAQNGLKALSISSGLVYWGLAAFLGMKVEKATDSEDPGVDLAERLAMARKALPEYDFIHLHSKAPDQAAHRKDPVAKVKVIEALDRGLGRELATLLADPDLLVAVTADHSTPSSGLLVHGGEPVPLLFAGPGVRRDTVQCYDEISAAGGALGPVRGGEFMALVLNYLERTKLIGTREAPADQPFWPGDYQPFRIKG
ncbi:MAG: alkaline phosphatase family protein [Desulfurivibrio sp.]|nr:alkaline phosphatase family protein [Desulfurivibrio sp.]